ncbi:MAG TPA: ferrous iron transport protein A [Nitrospiraceae bacterium]|nr:MAG: iron transporter FeoA [Nitrospirae bacterium GWA2_46_11]HCZ11724.1 ferrous iron transport protein A [Nitrospiraceae bacterium]
MAPLGLLSEGEKAEIMEIKTQKVCGHGSGANESFRGKSQLCHAEDMGLRIGKMVEMLNNAGRGSLLVKVDESRIAIGRGMAMKIMVRRI